MKKLLLMLGAVALLAAGAGAAVKSGLPPGASLPAFDVVDVTGPNQGKQLCYRCSYGGNPVLAAFIKPGTATAAATILRVQKIAAKHKGLKTFVVMMGGPETKSEIEKIAGARKISIPVTFLPGGTGAPDISKYRINPAVDTTVLLWNKGTVRHGSANPAETDWAEVEKLAATIVHE